MRLKSLRPPISPLCSWLAIVIFIFLLSVYGRNLQLFISNYFDLRWIAGAVFATLLLLLVQINSGKTHKTFSLVSVFFSSALLCGGIIAVVSGYLRPIEAVHFLLFSSLGWISGSVFSMLYGAAAVMIISLGDETLQYFLSDRVGDLHDVVINCISGLTGLLLRRK